MKVDLSKSIQITGPGTPVTLKGSLKAGGDPYIVEELLIKALEMVRK